MPDSIGFWYESDGYDTSGKRLLGRQSAGESFLRSLVQHARASRLYCVAPSQDQYKDCVGRIAAWQMPRQMAHVLPDDPRKIAEAGLLYRPDPVLANLAWVRRTAGQRLYSLCGVTHTICTKETMQHIGQLAIAPLQPWDALICTSTAVKTAVERMLEEWGQYLKSRCGGAPANVLKLPVIALGIDAGSFAPSKETQVMRAGLRKTLEIKEDDLAVLYVGRLNFYAKAHPIPMYLSMERAARTTGKKLHLIQVGWFEVEREENAFKAAAKKFCPSVSCVFLDGRQPEIRRQAWSASDLFVSLSDNVQETFGLTPLEAMAAGLAVICTDWNGYQATVRHEIDGFRVPVMMPPAGSGSDLARSYLSERLGYNGYIGRAAQSTAADMDEVTKALVNFIQHPELRAKMGAAGQDRAKKEFDWSVIIRRYEELWDELNELRARGAEIAPPPAGRSGHPLCDDPFRVFEHYSERHFSPGDAITLGSCGTVETVGHLTKDWMSSFGADCRLKTGEFGKVLDRLKSNGTLRMSEFLSEFPGREDEVYRTVGWLMKFGVVRIVPG